jgi:predicted nuclease with TOPRIM domain
MTDTRRRIRLSDRTISLLNSHRTEHAFKSTEELILELLQLSQEIRSTPNSSRRMGKTDHSLREINFSIQTLSGKVEMLEKRLTELLAGISVLHDETVASRMENESLRDLTQKFSGLMILALGLDPEHLKEIHTKQKPDPRSESSDELSKIRRRQTVPHKAEDSTTKSKTGN